MFVSYAPKLRITYSSTALLAIPGYLYLYLYLFDSLPCMTISNNFPLQWRDGGFIS